MTKSWEQEKAYCRKRADEIGAEMNKAIEITDKRAFCYWYEKSFRYMTVKERAGYMGRFLNALMPGREVKEC